MGHVCNGWQQVDEKSSVLSYKEVRTFQVMYMLWYKFIFGLNLLQTSLISISLCSDYDKHENKTTTTTTTKTNKQTN